MNTPTKMLAVLVGLLLAAAPAWAVSDQAQGSKPGAAKVRKATAGTF
jgi:hypothetical protein